MFIDPEISRAKFDLELNEFKAQRPAHQRRGIWLVDDTFPEAFFVLMASKPKPPIVVFGVVINFEDYDIEPPSIRFVNPFTRARLMAAEVTHPMMRFTRVRGPTGEPTGPLGEIQVEQVPLLQAEDPQQFPFICLQGVREYHEHPAHTGDSWWLYRGSGPGKLAYILNILATYGIDNVQGIRVNVQVTGLNVGVVPE